MSTVPEYIAKIIAFLNQETAWNQSIVADITSFLNKANQTKDDVDMLVMAVTKKVEARLRETLANHIGRTVPAERAYGTRLLDYAVNSHLIPSKHEPLYSLLHLIFKEPRNSSHHTFPDYPFKTTVMAISEANEALQRIDTLIQPTYSSHSRTNYDPSNKKVSIETTVLRPDGTYLPSSQKVEVTLGFLKSVKTIPLAYGPSNTWKAEYDVRGETCGTVGLFVRGYDSGKAFQASSGASMIPYPTGQKCPFCNSEITSSFVSICPRCGKTLPVV